LVVGCVLGKIEIGEKWDNEGKSTLKVVDHLGFEKNELHLFDFLHNTN
jgi:hypothetical protein